MSPFLALGSAARTTAAMSWSVTTPRGLGDDLGERRARRGSSIWRSCRSRFRRWEFNATHSPVKGSLYVRRI